MPMTLELQTNAAAAPETPAFRVSEVMLMRVGGLPITSINRLKDVWISQAIHKSNELASALQRHADSLSVSLYEAINMAKGNAPLQHALLALRRGIYNGRRLSEADLLAGVPHLDEDTCEALAEWRRLRQELDAHHAAAEVRIQQAFDEHRQALKELASDDSFRKGVLLSSPSFERALNDYIHSGERKPDKKMRRTERTLLSYLLRTTHKTSPFSTLTPISMARLSDHAPARGTRFEIPAPSITTAVRPNLGILARVAQALRQNATHYPELRLVMQPPTALDRTRVTYWKRTETPVRAGGPVHTRVSESKFSIHRTPSLELILERMGDSRSLTVREIGNLLVSHAFLPESEAVEYIRLLVDNGFLDVAGLRQSLFDPSYWTRVAAELDALPGGAMMGVARGIRNVLRIAAEFELAPTAARPRLMQSAEAEVNQILEAVGNQGPVPNPLLYEDSRLEGKPLLIHRGTFEAPLAALAELQRMLTLFDPFLVTKASLKSLFKKRFGAGGICRDILGFSDFFQEAFYRPYIEATNGGKKATDQLNPFGRGNVNPLRLPEVTALQSARAELLARMEEALKNSASEAEYEIPEQWVQEFGAQLLGRHRVLSNSFFFQIARHDGEAAFVLNHVYGGFGCMFTRFMHLFESSGGNPLEEALRANLAALQPGDVQFAELQGGHDTNLNQHRLLATAELAFPGEGATSSDGKVEVSELTIRHDAATDDVYLYSERLAKKIVPVYLGMLYPLVLPELQTLLLHFAPPTVLKSTLSARVLPESTEVLHQPRIRYKKVIIERARWIARLNSMPVRQGQEKDYDYMLRFARWRELMGIPSEVFALLIAPEAGSDAAGKNNGALGGPQKPFYLDLDQPLFLLQLEKLAADNSGFIQFTECLPSPKDAILSHGEDRYVSEFVVDINQGQLS